MNREHNMPRQRKRVYTTREAAMARLAVSRRPLRFRARGRDEWREWRRAFRRAIVRELGPMPEAVPLRPEILERAACGGYVREKIVFDSERFASVPAWVLTPRPLQRGERRPAVLCLHGHGPGKDPMVGLGPNREPLDDYSHQLACRLAERGYVTITPDWRGFGERSEDPEWVRPGRDPCNVTYYADGYFGYHRLGLQIWDGMRTLDYLVSRAEVAGGRIGCIGCSFGGTMTTYLSALDQRIGAAVIVCYVSSLRDALARANYCGAQYMPGLGKYADIPEVAMLIAPRPLMVQVGEKDECFTVDDAAPAGRRVGQPYRLLGVEDRFSLDVFPGEHEIDVAPALAWFDRWLKGPRRPPTGI
jgi:dienelactone hydrolase